MSHSDATKYKPAQISKCSKNYWLENLKGFAIFIHIKNDATFNIKSIFWHFIKH